MKSVLDIFLYKLQDPLAPLFSLIILFCFFLGTFLERGELMSHHKLRHFMSRKLVPDTSNLKLPRN